MMSILCVECRKLFRPDTINSGMCISCYRKKYGRTKKPLNPHITEYGEQMTKKMILWTESGCPIEVIK